MDIQIAVLLLLVCHCVGISTIHPSNLHCIGSRQELKKFLQVANEGGQLAVLSYEVCVSMRIYVLCVGFLEVVAKTVVIVVLGCVFGVRLEVTSGFPVRIYFLSRNRCHSSLLKGNFSFRGCTGSHPQPTNHEKTVDSLSVCM